MKKRSLEKLFARYVRRGDVRALGEVFDRAAPELLVIAGHIARDVAAAEDLVQTTFVVAIERGGTFDARRPLMPWLVGILTRHSRYQGRREARVAPPDRVGAPRPADPVLASEAREFGSALSSALSELPNTYRDVLFAHLAGGMKPREIARDLGRAPGTVRVQIHRGLDLLRKALPAGFALGATAAVLPTRGLAAMRGEVLAAGARAISTGAAASSAAVGSGGVLLKTTAYVGVLLALSTGTGWLVGSTRRPLERPAEELALVESPALPEREPSGATRSPEPSTRREVEGRDTSTTPRASVPPPDPTEERYVVVGRLGAHGRASLEGARVLVEPETSPGAFATGEATRKGAFEVDVDALIPHVLYAGCDLVVTVDHPAYLVERGVVKTKLDNSHGLEADVRSCERLERARRDLERTSNLDRRTGTRALTMKLTLREPEAFVTGTTEVLNTPVSVALFALDKGRAPGLLPVDSKLLPEGGEFRLRAAEEGPHLVVAVAEGCAPHGVEVDVTASERPIEIGHVPLEPGEAFSGQVRLPEGRPAEESRVTATYREEAFIPLAWQDLGWTERGLVRARAECLVQSGGRFRLAGLAPGIHRLEALPPSGLPSGGTRDRSEYDASTPGITLFANVALVRFSVSGAGTPIDGASIRRTDTERPPPAITGSAGTAELLVPSLTPSRFVIAKAGFRPAELSIPPLRPGGSLSRSVALEPVSNGATELVIVASGAVELPPALLVQREEHGVRHDVGIAYAEGDAFRVGGLPSGNSTLVLSPLDPSSFLLDEVVKVDLREGEATWCMTEFREGGSVSLAFVDSDARGARIEVEDHGRELPARVTRAGDRATFPTFPPGDYTIRIAAEGFDGWHTAFKVAPARELVLPVKLVPDEKRFGKATSLPD